MRLSRVSSLIAVALFAFQAHAACEGPEYAGFDFWLGDWQIEQKIRDGEKWIELPARTSVRKTLDGCALLENWQGQVQFPWTKMNAPEAMTGLSLRYYLPDEGVWRIQWMDTQNPVLSEGHYGAIENGIGEFEPKEKPANGRWGKIVFERKSADHVYWHLDLTTDAGKSYTPIWLMDMKRARQ